MANLAVKGGTPVRTKGFPGWTVTTPADAENLIKTYKSGKWGSDGEQNRKFCRDFADFSGVKHCLTVANGTVSIELILRALGIGRGDEVIVPPYTFIASVSALIYAGVTPVFADIEQDTFNLSPKAAEKAITPRTKAIMPVYVGGRPADLDAFEAICEKHGLYLIGDAAQAVGSEYNGKGVANYGIATSISCQASKNLTCGEGGIILTNDDGLYERISQMLSGGENEKGELCTLSLASGMSEFQASILNTQLLNLSEQIERRMENAAYLDSRLAGLDCVYTMKNDPKITKNSLHLYTLGIREEKLGSVSRADFLRALNAEGIPLATGYFPIYTFPCVTGEYANRCMDKPVDTKPDTPVTELVSNHEGCWFYHSVLLGDKKDMDDIANAVIKVYENLDELR